MCDWPLSETECASCSAFTDLSEADQALFGRMAADYLWNWTNKVYGVCEEEIRPCTYLYPYGGDEYGDGAFGGEWSDACSSGTCSGSCSCGGRGGSTFWGRGPFPGSGSPWQPVLIGGEWFNISCGKCGDGPCGCSGPTSVTIPGPVQSVTSVMVGTEVLDPSAYRVDNHRCLVREDGEEWPVDGDWVIVYKRGTPVPPGGQVAAAVLACELAKAACGDKSCALPQRVQSITRQGVTIAMLDSFDDIDKGHTGIWLIDSWIASVTKSSAPSFVVSPDVRPKRGPRRVSWRATP